MGHTTNPHRPVDLPRLATEHSRRLVYAGFVFVATGLSIGTITAVAYWSGHPLVVPSLGPTAFLIFNRSQSAAARPRNAILGHLAGAAAGYAALVSFGLAHSPSVVSGGLTPTRIGAATMSIALTSAVMILARIEHGPAGATTLIVSLGFMRTPGSLLLLMAGVVALVVLGVAIDRLAGLRIPLWAPVGGAVQGHGGSNPGPGARQVSVRRQHRHRLARHRRERPRHGGSGRQWVVPTEGGRKVWIGPDVCRVKVDGTRTGSTYSVVQLSLDPGKRGTLLHTHYGFAETYIVLEGRLSVQIGEERVEAAGGEVVCVPAGVAHLPSCAGHRPVRYLCVTEGTGQSEPEFLP